MLPADASRYPAQVVGALRSSSRRAWPLAGKGPVEDSCWCHALGAAVSRSWVAPIPAVRLRIGTGLM